MRFALVICIGGLLATVLYSRWSEPPPRQNYDVEVVGFVQSATGFHLRQRAGSTLWDPVQDGDAIYPGDEIKTGASGDLTLALPSTGKALDIETDSKLKLHVASDAVEVRTSEGYFSALPRSESNQATRRLSFSEAGGQPLNSPVAAMSYMKEGEAPLREINPHAEGLPRFENIQWKAPPSQMEFELNPDFPKGVDLVWDGENSAWSLQIEWGISRRKMTQKKVFSSAGHGATVVMPLGKQFWRWSLIETVSGKILYTSPTSRLMVRGIFPPAVIGPTGSQAVRVSTPDERVLLRWSADKRFAHYNVEVAGDAAFKKILSEKKELKATEFSFSPGKFGAYYWRLSGKEASGGREVRTKTHAFKFLPKDYDRIEMKWATQDGSQQRFLGKEPSLSLKWTTKPLGDHTFRVKIRPADGELGRTTQAIVKTRDALVPVERAGTFQVIIDGLNADGEVIGTTPPIQVSIKPQPLLKPPTLLSEHPPATASGQVLLQWTAIDGAREYQVEVKSPDGKVYGQAARKNELQLKKLLPGIYNFSISAIDAHGRPSERSPAGRFTVPEKSSLKGPKIRKVEVE